MPAIHLRMDKDKKYLHDLLNEIPAEIGAMERRGVLSGVALPMVYITIRNLE